MTIAASGAVSFSDLRTEFVGGSSAISLGDLYRGGSNILSKAGDNPAVNMAATVPTSGVIDVQDFYSTAKGFKSTISSNTTNVDADALFGDDYDVNYPKVIDVNSGVTIGGSGDEAIDIPSGLAGTLTINNSGSILGSGGAANGGAGGSAIACAASGVTINNLSGALLAGGGGGGGQGGTGGGGSYSQTLGPYVAPITTYSYVWFTNQYNKLVIRWNYSFATNGSVTTPSGNTFSTGGYTYTRGNYYDTFECGNDVSCAMFYVSRTGTVTSSGGSGGAGGVGQGYNVTNASGSSGAAGGTSAGSGGAGGAGATYGTAGSTGSTGANGNASNGSAGSAGGAAGAAVSGTSVTMNNSGTLHGTVA
tara:strand:- start:2234 stop:3322 length:1089 start_codon:yes stop_codon:yes gene_type:complete